METATMGRVSVAAKIENLKDLMEVADGARKLEDVRHIEVQEALVDTGAKMLSLPRRFIHQLGLQHFETREALMSAGRQPCEVYHAVQLTVQGRRCLADVAAVPDDCPVLIGYLALEGLDFVVDPKQRCLIGDPFHGGEHLIDLF